ncbi:phosphoadenylyl-sulfate reductase [Candidatus Nitrosacidococcus sp. I8]|uniref:phosphoadenylyl-sulfate reductase n=1 Tax=Candidatus Nitrosacidococcus sp. I8 TaxID=2942908 RepID=UPI00222663C0|nr:phosphoadenylyl-sulfate reductase [Candidatus Nitrosacidococcus sp. I8]CAH9017396.1 Thioredoxin-dependent 5'-adenylylsulfate reductase [Candidatus Nitrosacidococcus sp. I8]
MKLKSDNLLTDKVIEVTSLLTSIVNNYAPACFSSSFGAEDMVLIDMIFKSAPEIKVFTLDTGRLPQETYELIQKITEYYHQPIYIYFPESGNVESYTKTYGPNGFYQSVELRKKCCHIRKVLPLKRALLGKKSWITGMRREQSITRKDLSLSEWDSEHKLKKFNPLITWTRDDVWDYIKKYNVPYNILHDRGYESIGCAPCTRAITVGEDIRAGRWWWEDADTKECGLHKN